MFRKVEDFILSYLKKKKIKKFSNDVLQEAVRDTFHVGDKYYYDYKYWIILGFDAFGAWMIKESDFKAHDISTRTLTFCTYYMMMRKYTEHKCVLSKQVISDTDMLKYKMQYEDIRKFSNTPCIEDTCYYNKYFGKTRFQILRMYHSEFFTVMETCLFFFALASCILLDLNFVFILLLLIAWFVSCLV